MSKVDKKGELFFIELLEEKLHPTELVCLCSDCATDDTGYGTDSESSISAKSHNCSSAAPSEYKERAKINTRNPSKCSNLQCLERTETVCESCEMNRMKKKDVTFAIDLNGYKVGGSKRQKIKVRTKSDVKIFCEHVLGIVPGHFRGRKGDGRIRVEGLVNDGQAIHYQHIVRIGDWLQCVNGKDVTWDDLADFILSAQSKQITLTVQSMPPDDTIADPEQISSNEGQLLQLITGEKCGGDDALSYNQFYSVMYLSLQGLTSDNMADKADIVYQFPDQDNRLLAVRGLFITLSQEIQHVSSYSANCSTLLFDKNLVHVSYHQEGPDILLMAAPASRMNRLVLQTMLREVVRLLRVLHGSLSDVFRNTGLRAQLSHFFGLVHHNVFSTSSSLPSIGMDLCSPRKVQYLPLSQQVTSNIDNVLSEYEATDFIEMCESFYGCRRSYAILGSCLFYKSYLLCSHLPTEDLYDVNLYLKHQCLFSLCDDHPVGQLVIWKEVFPTRQCHDLEEEQIFGYTEPVGARWFWLIVGLKHSLLCILLERGGCTSQNEGVSNPEAFYIDQARVTLLQLDSLGIPAHCEARMREEMVPAIASADWIASKKFSTLDQSENTTQRISGLGSSLKESNLLRKVGSSGIAQNFADRLSIDSNRGMQQDGSYKSSKNKPVEGPDTLLSNSRHHYRRNSLDSNESAESVGSDDMFKVSRKSRQFAVHGGQTSPSFIPASSVTDPSFRKLTAGEDNCMFHFLHLDSSMGVFVCPSWILGITDMYSTVHQELTKNFYRCCTQLRYIFDTDRRKQAKNNSNLDHGGNSLDRVREQGVMFQYTAGQTTDKKAAILSYWVVGRHMPKFPSQEVYVCFQDSTPHNVVQMAFQLGFG